MFCCKLFFLIGNGFDKGLGLFQNQLVCKVCFFPPVPSTVLFIRSVIAWLFFFLPWTPATPSCHVKGIVNQNKKMWLSFAHPHVNFCKEMFSRMFMLSFSVQWKHKVTRGCQGKKKKYNLKHNSMACNLYLLFVVIFWPHCCAVWSLTMWPSSAQHNEISTTQQKIAATQRN